jgi:sigma-B regulation protein RsbU (phosphoserine phosphatase)
LERQVAITTALIVGDDPAITRELDSALRQSGFDVIVVTAEEAVTHPDLAVTPETLMVSAAVGLDRIALLTERFAVQGRPPTTVVYPEDDIEALEAFVRAGFDYIAPPFAPSLLRSRLTTCRERGQLTMAVEEMATAASLQSYERDLAIAHEIQSGFLPDSLPEPDGWELDAKFHPARIVAGDFYDVFELAGGRRLALLVADVCDKGVGAALFMALIRTMLRHTAEQAGGWDLPGDGPVQGSGKTLGIGLALAPTLSVGAGPLLQAVSSTNSYMARHHRRQGYFCTLFFGVLDPRSGALLYVNGGHNPAVLVRADGDHLLLGPTGPAVGMFASSSYLLDQVSLRPGDWLYMYTDGVTEARDASGEFFGMERVMNVVTRPGRTASELVEAIDKAIRHHVGAARQYDDITMLALRRSP